MRRLAIGVIALALHAPGHALAGDPPLDEVLANAGGPVIVDFAASWCGPCRVFTEKILPSPEVQHVLLGARLVTYDTDQEPGRSLARRFGVRGLPTFVVLDARGHEVARQRGLGHSATPKAFARFFQGGLLLAEDEPTMRARLRASAESASGLLEAARWYAARDRVDEAVASYDRAASADQRIAADAVWERDELLRHHGRVRSAGVHSLDFARQFPGARNTTGALLLAAASGQVSAADVAPVLRAHVDGLADADALLTSAYTALLLNAVDAARYAATALVQAQPKRARSYFVFAEVELIGGGERADVDRAAMLARDLAGPTEAGACDRLLGRVHAGDRSSPTLEELRGRARAFVADEEAREALLAPIEPLLTEERSRIDEYLAFEQAAAARAAARCADESGDHDLATVRLGVPPAGGRPIAAVTVSRVPDPLAACLESSLRDEYFPPPPFGLARQEITVVLDGGSAPAERPTWVTLFDRALFVEATHAFDERAGFANAFAAHARLAFPLPWKLDAFTPTFVVEGGGGVTGGGEPVWDSGVLAGLAVRSILGLYAGFAVSHAGDAIPRAPTVPVELRLSLPIASQLAVVAWVRSSFVFVDETRQDGAPDALFFADELATGALLYVRRPFGWYAGLAFREQVGARLAGAVVGLSF